MRHATRLLFASALVLAATRAGAQVPDNTPSLSDELLQLWNKEYTVESDAALVPSDESRLERNVPSTTPLGGRSMTPNLDRLLGRSMDATPHSSAPVAKDSPYGFAPRSIASKGGSSTADKKPKDPKPPKPPEDCDPPTPTPEPASMLLLLGAGAAAGARAIRKRRKK